MTTPLLSAQLGKILRAAACTAIFLSAVSAHAGIKSDRLLAAIIKQTPESMLVPAGEQMKRAEAAAAEIPGAGAFWGVGASMEPLFADKTAIVVAPINFKHLKKGMTVVYVNSRGRKVAHSLTGDLPGGWIAQGVNCDQEDDDLVTAENLIGVIVQAFSQVPSEYRVALTKQLVAKGRLPSRQS